MENTKIKMIAIGTLAIVAFFATYFFIAHKNNKENIANQFKPNGVSLISQNNNEFTLNLVFNGGDKPGISSIRYVALLYKVSDNGEIMGDSPMDTKSYDDHIIIGKNDGKSITKNISYVAPDYLDGKYVLVVNYLAESGNQIDSFIVGNVNLQSQNTGFLEILPDTCFLQVEGEDPNINHANGQGVDIKRDENIIVTCTVKNHFDKEVTTNVKFKNFFITHELNESVEQEGLTFSTVSFDADVTKNISLSIAKALVPQAYDVGLYLTDTSGTQISNMAYFHYVIAGESARILNATLDSDHYAQNTPITATISYGGSADNFDGARLGGTKNEKLTAEIDVRNQAGQSCLAEEKITDLSTEKIVDTNIVMNATRECANPFIVATIRGKDGVVLDTRTFLRDTK
ncbi:MAG: hypothetical protein WC819_05985 [Parcubacteria group bacterium]|jgi:hypothetical protein